MLNLSQQLWRHLQCKLKLVVQLFTLRGATPMVTQLQPLVQEDIIYPQSDGQPMADNTKQFELIVFIKKNCDLLFANNPDVFVAGDLLWYPVKDDNVTRRAPDIMVVFGRRKEIEVPTFSQKKIIFLHKLCLKYFLQATLIER